MSRRPSRSRISAFDAKVAHVAVKRDRVLVQRAGLFDPGPSQAGVAKARLDDAASCVFGSAGIAPTKPLIGVKSPRAKIGASSVRFVLEF